MYPACNFEPGFGIDSSSEIFIDAIVLINQECLTRRQVTILSFIDPPGILNKKTGDDNVSDGPSLHFSTDLQYQEGNTPCLLDTPQFIPSPSER